MSQTVQEDARAGRLAQASPRAARLVRGGGGLAYWTMVHQLVTRRHPIADGHERIYLYHIPKTGGTSLNQAFLGLGGGDADALIYRINHSSMHAVRSGPFILTKGFQLIRRGIFSYGFGHRPSWRFALAPGTFSVTVLRDPLDRLISSYRHRVDPMPASTLGARLDEDQRRRRFVDFDTFLSNAPRHELLNQVAMFSERLDVSEAVEAASRCSAVLFTDHLADGIRELNATLGTSLPAPHVRRSEAVVDIGEQQRERARSLLAPEYELYDRLAALRPGWRAAAEHRPEP